jgi:proteasome lid subunit RPN8/RPN11
MLTILLPPDVREEITKACVRAGKHETGGMLFGEHVGDDEFHVIEATVAGQGSMASFLRALTEGLARLEAFFRRTKRDYRRFNYLGEWHSHPSFVLRPSSADDKAMFDIVEDSTTGARFAVSLIVKLESGWLEAVAYAYFPQEERQDALVVFEEPAR